jgi:hypothetical protein
MYLGFSVSSCRLGFRLVVVGGYLRATCVCNRLKYLEGISSVVLHNMRVVLWRAFCGIGIWLLLAMALWLSAMALCFLQSSRV